VHAAGGFIIGKNNVAVLDHRNTRGSAAHIHNRGLIQFENLIGSRGFI